jgi:hypothetical protein
MLFHFLCTAVTEIDRGKLKLAKICGEDRKEIVTDVALIHDVTVKTKKLLRDSFI